MVAYSTLVLPDCKYTYLGYFSLFTLTSRSRVSPRDPGSGKREWWGGGGEGTGRLFQTCRRLSEINAALGTPPPRKGGIEDSANFLHSCAIILLYLEVV
jgi:hypothetical protein